jgi:hypothetical protein
MDIEMRKAVEEVLDANGLNGKVKYDGVSGGVDHDVLAVVSIVQRERMIGALERLADAEERRLSIAR